MIACSPAGLRSASLPVTPKHLVRNSIEISCIANRQSEAHKPAMNLIAVTLGKKQYAAALVEIKVESPVTLMAGVPSACGMTKMLSSGFWVAIIGSFDLGFSRTAP